MKKIILFLSAITFSIAGFSQSPTFQKSDLVFNAGIGFGSSLYGSAYTTTLPAISISGEYGVIDDFITDDMTLGIGGYVGFAGSKYEYSGFGTTYGWKYNYTVIGARGALHYPLVDKLDTYAGLMLGYNVVSFKEIGTAPLGITNSQSGGMTFSAYLGARYYLANNFAVMAELGYGIAYLNVGIALKI